MRPDESPFRDQPPRCSGIGASGAFAAGGAGSFDLFLADASISRVNWVAGTVCFSNGVPLKTLKASSLVPSSEGLYFLPVFSLFSAHCLGQVSSRQYDFTPLKRSYMRRQMTASGSLWMLPKQPWMRSQVITSPSFVR